MSSALLSNASLQHTQVLIIGSGPAGYTAAIYAARAMLSPVLVEGIQPGGQLTITTDVENWPGQQSIQGPKLMHTMQTHADALQIKRLSDVVARLDLGTRPFGAWLDTGAHYTADSIILATGASARWLGLDSETRYKGYGVSACATCDGFFFRDQDVAVVGGGNTAVEEALFLTRFARSVTLIHRRDTLRADRILQNRLFANPKIRILWNRIVHNIIGSADDSPPRVTGIHIADTNNDSFETLSVSGVFIAIGHTPMSALVAGQVDTNAGGYVITRPGTTQTSCSGVFAAGDITDETYRQAITAAGMGCMAALDAERYLAEPSTTTTKPLTTHSQTR